MPIKNSGSEREPIDMMELGRRIAARKAALGVPDPPRNAGKNRGRSRSSTRSPRAGRCRQRRCGPGSAARPPWPLRTLGPFAGPSARKGVSIRPAPTALSRKWALRASPDERPSDALTMRAESRANACENRRLGA